MAAETKKVTPAHKPGSNTKELQTALDAETPYVRRAVEMAQRGCQLRKVRSRRSQNLRTFYLDEDGMILRYKGSMKIKCLRTLMKKPDDLSEIFVPNISEVREGTQSDKFRSVYKDRQPPADRCFVLGIGEKYETLDLIAPTTDIRDLWIVALRFHINRLQKICEIDPVKARKTFLAAFYNQADKNKDGKLSLNEVIQLMNEMNAHVDRHYAGLLCARAKAKTLAAQGDADTSDSMSRATVSGQVALDLEEFITFFTDLTVRSDLTKLFKHYDNCLNFMSPSELLKFLKDNQQENVTPELCEEIITSCEICPILKEKLMLSEDGFVAMFWNPYMGVRNMKCSEVYQDMTKPLSHYYIDSSHNTYIETNQLTSYSRLDSYSIALKNGCRCVEMDVWDGDEEPDIFHGIMGFTLTSKLRFRGVIETVNKYAFETSQYPVILSIENHCSVEQQRVMAKIMKEVLGDKLLTKQLPENCTELPSPEELKGKFIVKCKKIRDLEDDILDESDFKDIAEANKMSVVEFKQKLKQKTQDMEKTFRVAAELSDCIVICQTAPFKSFERSANEHTFKNISSFSERKTMQLYEQYGAQFVKYNMRQLSRCYPAGSRTSSSNYDPVPCWLAGCQLVALNYQTPDEAMHYNKGLFEDNGRCGYVLKPEFLRSEAQRCPPDGPYPSDWLKKIKIKVISGHQLPKKGGDATKSIIDPYVQINVVGVPADKQEWKTKTVENNGFNPEWNEEHLFIVRCSPFALVYFQVIDFETRRSDVLIAQYCIPLSCIQEGYRTVFLRSPKGETDGNGDLLVYIEVTGG